MLRKAIVVECHPEDNSVDLVMCDDGARLTGVPVMAHSASARSGSVDMPEMPKKTGASKWDITQRHGQDMEALVAVMGRGNPLVLGFIYPQISQMTFKDPKRKLSRHQSDFYHTIDGEGNFEICHPSGAFVRIAKSIEHEDLTKKNFDESLEFDRNKDLEIKIHISTSEGTATITLDPYGVITIHAEKEVTIEAAEKISLSAEEIKLNGKVTISGASVRHNNVNIGSSHKHGGVTPGGGQSGPPAAD